MNQTTTAQKQARTDDGWTDHVTIDDAPTRNRPEHTGQLFPRCKALRGTPTNYPSDADLDDEEMNETDPNKFAYSEAEIDAWNQIVNDLLDETTGPRL